MIRAGRVVPAGRWDGVGADRVVLDLEGRHRRRAVLRTEGGQELLLDLPEVARLRDGDGLVLDDGSILRVAARPEPVLDVMAPDPESLVRIAWHLGNRHLPMQILTDGVRIRADHVIADMLAGLGALVTAREAPFDPEAGAYSGHGHAP